MALLGTITKQSREVEAYDVSYVSYLSTRPNVVISSVVAETSPAGLSISAQIYDGNKVKVTYSGGTDNTVYKTTVLTTTSDSMVLEDEVLVFVKNI